MRIRRSFSRACGILAMLGVSATAQGPVVRGVVYSGDSSRVPLATIELATVGSRTTDSTGRFQFPNVAPGRYALHVRRLGFAPFDDSISVFRTDTLTHVIRLDQLPEALPTVVIRGEMVTVPKGFEAIYRRGAHSFGYFITAEQIERRNPMQTRDLLVNVPGVVMIGSSVTFERCQRRGSGGGAAAVDGAPQVYIDGQRVTRFSRQFSDAIEDALQQVEPRQIQAIEVYTGLSQIPGDFAQQACAAIAIWTKRE